MSWLNLENKVVIVTGGASGIGEAVTEEFLSQGAQVVVADMNPEVPAIKGVKEDNFLYVVTDVTKKDSVKKYDCQSRRTLWENRCSRQ